MTGTVGAMVSFPEGSQLLTELAGVAVDAKQVERTAEALGKQIAEDERQWAHPSDTLALPQTLYLGREVVIGIEGRRSVSSHARKRSACDASSITFLKR